MEVEKKRRMENINIQQKPDVDFIGDITDLGQFDDNSIEEFMQVMSLNTLLKKKLKQL